MRKKDVVKEKVHCQKCHKRGTALFQKYEVPIHRSDLHQHLASPPLGWTTDLICKACQQKSSTHPIISPASEAKQNII